MHMNKKMCFCFSCKISELYNDFRFIAINLVCHYLFSFVTVSRTSRYKAFYDSSRGLDRILLIRNDTVHILATFSMLFLDDLINNG